MPIISYFFGIIIRMYFDDHLPPHFHAEYQGREGVFSVEDGTLMDGNLPRKAVALVSEWAVVHSSELFTNWELAKNNQPLLRIKGADDD